MWGRGHALHEKENWLIITNCSNGFNTVNRIAVLAEIAPFVWAFSPFEAKFCGKRSASVLFRMNAGEPRTVACSKGCAVRGVNRIYDVLLIIAAGA